MHRTKPSARMSLLGSVKGKNAIRFRGSKPEFPPSYSKWLELKERQQNQDAKLAKFKRSAVRLDRDLDRELRSIEVRLLTELARDDACKVPKDALRAIANDLWQYHCGSRFTHWSSRLPRSKKRDADPQLEYLKGLAVAFINQADSRDEEKRRRSFVAAKFGISKNHHRDWEMLVKKRSLSVPDLSGLVSKRLPDQIPDSVIELAGEKFLVLKRKRNLENKQ